MPRKFKRKLYDFMSLTANDTQGDLWIYGDIVDDKWYDTDVAPNNIRDALNDMGTVGTLNLRVNSYGGSCVAGNTIVNLIDNYKRKTGARVHAYIDGIAASMGSGVVMAADYIFMAENAIFMVHKPFSMAYGNSFDMEKEAEVLEKVEDTLVKNYMRHFNGTEEEMRQLMADESWLTADEALEYGLCDEIVPAVEVAASANGICINGKDFRDENLKNRFKETEGKTVFEYDNALNNIGISKDVFGTLNTKADTINSIAEIVCNSLYNEISTTGISINNLGSNGYGITTNGTWTYPMDIVTPQITFNGIFDSDFISKEKAKDFLGKEFSAEEVLDFAKSGMEMDREADSKAKAYDRLVSSAIEDALKSGIKAKGESFNDSKWKKILNTLDYEEIVDQKNEWEAEAKIALKAGMKVSQPWAQDKNPDNSAVNPDDYKF